MAYIENKILEKVKLDNNVTKKITQNNMSGRIFVEFLSTSPRMMLQKSFQDTIEGRKDAEKFSNSIKSLNDLKDYFFKKSS